MNALTDKVEYVRDESGKPHGKHHCHWPGCGKDVPPAKWGCLKHWYMLPAFLRRKIWAAFQPGQEITKTPSRRYIEVAREVQNWITTNNGVLA